VKTSTYGLIFAILCVAGCSVYGYYFIYGKTAIVLDVYQAKEFLWRARASADLKQIADYMNKSLNALKNREGNPNWLWHLPDTDFGLIKKDLEKNVAMALNVSQTEEKGSYGYQRTIDNMQEICIELNEHLDCAIQWMTDFHPTTLTLNLIGWGLMIIIGVKWLWRKWNE